MKLWVILALSAGRLSAQAADLQAVDNAFFEKEIRPVLVNQCFGCHSSKLRTPMGGLVLDTKAGMRAGGDGGPILVPGSPDASRLMEALEYKDSELRMPPTGKLPAREIDAFRKWIAGGAPDPREDKSSAAPVAKRGMDIETGRKWWSFQAVHEAPAPKVKDAAWARRKIDFFVLARLEENHVSPSPAAAAATLIQRAYLDLTGLRPTYDEVAAFAKDPSPDAYERLVERLLDSAQ
jgi:hypothetical protein